MGEKKILIVHPYDITTSFLESIASYLRSAFPDDIHYFSIEPNNPSHQQCLKRIGIHSSNGLIIFLGHGRSDKLYGSRGDEFYADASYDLIAAFPEKYYFNEDFIHQGNVDVLSGKKVFCLACNSNDKIAKYAYDKGVTSFLGFGDIPTSPEELMAIGLQNNGKDIARLMQVELNYIIKRGLQICIENNSTFEQLQNIMEFIINQRITDYLINNKSLQDRYILANNLYSLKMNIKIKGNKQLRIFD
jgi:hypothetical protein